MKNYINAKERSTCAVLLLAGAAADTMLNSGVSKEEQKSLKYIRTYAEKWYGDLIRRVGTEEGDRIGRLFNTCDVRLVPKTVPERTLPITDDDIQSLLDLFIDIFCKDCPYDKGEDFTGCPMYRVNSDLNIKLISDPEEGLCPFCYKEKEVS